MNKILIIDDEPSICDSLEFALEDIYKVYSTQNPEDGFEIIQNKDIDVVILDLKIGNIDGLLVLKQIKAIKDEIQVIIMTAYGSIESTVEAIKMGAINYVSKPLNMEELKVFISKALDYTFINSSLSNLKQIVEKEYSINGIIGRSQKLRNVLVTVNKIKDIDTTILITGESGTGKDILAKAIHFGGKRKDEKLEIVNCAAIPSNLLESELFGYEKGAFTGADKKKLGKIELANNGTLFLDEIGEMDMLLQAKILRVVEDTEIIPLGGENPKKVDVRIIAATNKDLMEEVRNNRFREDLYYRLNVINIKLPPLRDRKEDIVVLIKYFLDKYNKKFNKNIKGFTNNAINILEGYTYPGNVRELENLLERAVVLTDKEKIDVDDLPEYITSTIRDQLSDKDLVRIKVGISLNQAEKEVILKTLEHFKGNRRKTAECLKISERNLQYKIKQYTESQE
ncbi:sigma-54-dependent transcriptional regulator [Alkaliphilus serpentinus]|uniref:Stage 0 sporulation protein A homolog n=1 Tax=Alkaliphilus serpentinus TaxID=1482731 RepID=A0A833HNM0_9FIRM|nr:sigma-54 dependent transcriptional regulator [Alkaliphilus serpentinus]KAB3529696.1 sigma-54-dependent Fis family transcriptional regulator [Alkaliphilus serpentinus]